MRVVANAIAGCACLLVRVFCIQKEITMCLSIKINRPESVLEEGEHEGHQFTIVHNGMGYRCGYVRIPKGHPWHGKSYDDIYDIAPDLNVHGGLTFSEADVECDDPGKDNAWWLGFDCAHSGDAQDPQLPASYKMPYLQTDSHVRTQDYVRKECHSLCTKASDAGKANTPKT